MSGIRTEIVGNELHIILEMQKPTLSTSGKTFVVASSHGNVVTESIVDGRPVIIGVNAYIKK